MRIGICDDLPSEREHLKALLLAHTPCFHILEYSSGEALLANLADGFSLDLLFLDIYMDGINGMETAQKIRNTHNNLPIVFLTITPDFALAAFGVHALGYLLKPVQEAAMVAYLQKIEPSQPELPDIWVAVVGKSSVALNVRQIMYYEQRGHIGEVHMEDGQVHSVRMTFAEISDQLGGYSYMFTCGRAYLLNLHHIQNLQRQQLTMMDESVLPVPRVAYPLLREAYFSLYSGQ
ncbi:MAG: LytTR family DNA-binding domain-containing protein [Eubacteriales bacterium]